MKNEYQVIVGNIGTVYNGHDKVIARETFQEYKEQSQTRGMRASGESVVLLMNGEVEKEYFPKNNEDNS